ncbi:MAG: PspA/IM30 family protein [Oscillospiraceae bacterium]|nr:PspA/IM30 family protein [Oscillospiraceae bacterium]
MGILSRFKNIMAANINALLDKAEDPAKMIDQTLRQLANDLADVKKETASVMAEETRSRREADANLAEVKKNIELARKALTAGNEDHARVFLNKKNELEAKGLELQKLAEIAQGNAVQMRQMHDKLVKDINALKSRQATIKSNIAIAKATEKVNKMGAAGSKSEGALQAFDRFEKQAQERLDRAHALTALNEVPRDEAQALAELYKDGGGAALDDELAALKAEMGLAPAVSVEDEIAALKNS